MKTFAEWLQSYTKEHGTPPAHVMAEAAWKYAYNQAQEYTLELCGYDTGDSDLVDNPSLD